MFIELDPSFDIDMPTRAEAEADKRQADWFYSKYPPKKSSFPDPWEEFKDEPEYEF